MNVTSLVRASRNFIFFVVGIGLIFHAASAQTDLSLQSQTQKDRVQQIAQMLPDQPSACGAPITNRIAWDAFAKNAGGLIAEADRMLEEKTPALTDDSYVTFSKKGTRGEYEKPAKARLIRLAVFTQAECATNQGKYLNAIIRELTAILEEKTWTFPAFDKFLKNFKGETYDIDLGVSMRGATIATAVSWLGDKLPPELRETALKELRKRIFAPYLERIHSESSPLCYWINVNHNWNAVCHAGVILSALAILPSRTERAEILAGVEKYLPRYLSGFTSDGYCSEGMTYWNYGFGHYVVLTEAVLRATGGQLDFYRPEIVRHVAAYPDQLELSSGVFPAFADSPLYPTPQPWLCELSRKRFYLNGKSNDTEVSMPSPSLLLYEAAVASFPLAPRLQTAGKSIPPPLDPLRGWFPDAGVLISRPSQPGTSYLSAAISGGNNSDNHNHNDMGQFVVSVNGKMPVIDPGGELYTATSFGPNRYQSEMLNSFGHCVPVVAGKLQRDGKSAVSKVLETSFTPEQDRVTIDISSAYNVPELQKLERTFTYAREGFGSVEITDHFQFSTPQNFETALITYGSVTRESENSLILTDGPASVRVQISTGGMPFDISTVKIKSTKKSPPTRIGIALKAPTSEGNVTCRITKLVNDKE